MSHVYNIIRTKEEVGDLIKYCKKTKYASVDFETNADPIFADSFYPTVLGISFQPGSSYIIPLGHFDSPFLERDSKGIPEWVHILKWVGREVIENTKIVKIAQNLKFEYLIFMRYDIKMLGTLLDTMLAHYLLDENVNHGLKDMVREYLPEFSDYEDYEGSKLPWDQKPLEGLSKYCGIDCDATFRLMMFFESRLIKADLYKLFRNMLMSATKVLAESEYEGMRVDTEYLDNLTEEYQDFIEKLLAELKSNRFVVKYHKRREKQLKKDLIKKYKKEISDIEDEIDNAKDELDPTEFEKFKTRKLRTINTRENHISNVIAGNPTNKDQRKIFEPVNFSSPNQMIELLFTNDHGFNFEIVKYTTDKKTKKETDRPSTDEEVLLSLQDQDGSGFIKGLLRYRELTKLHSTYMKGIQEKTVNERVHTSFLLHGTVTGRLSSRQPNLQNIPRDTTAKEIKHMFLPRPGELLLQLDYSQAELRVLASLAKEESMLHAFNTGIDIHLASACKKHDWDPKERKAILEDDKHPLFKETKIARKQAKTINFGIVYGQTAKNLAGSLSEPSEGIIIDADEAQEFLDDFNNDFPRIAKYIKKMHRKLKKEGEVRSVFGRKRRLYDIWLDPQIDGNWGKVAKAQRDCINAPIQGAASDFTLFSSILIREQIKLGKLPHFVQVYTVHDSIGFSIKPEYIHEAVPILYDICKNPETKDWFGFQINNVEMKVDFEIGHRWSQLADYDKNKDYSKYLKESLLNT